MTSTRVCTICVLPETFPGISFDKDGRCNFCSSSSIFQPHPEESHKYLDRFVGLVESVRGKYCYDALMCYSGGKDSTYTLQLLKERFGMNVLALTMDNGFVDEQARLNITAVVESLGVDYLSFKPRFDVLKEVFARCSESDVFSPKTAERASMICTACMSFIKFSALRLAIEKKIPLIAFGWSPGQAPITSSIMKNNPSMVRSMQRAVFEPLHRIAGDAIRPYFLEPEHFDLGIPFPTNVHPLAFMPYNEDEIFRSIDGLGWKMPSSVDANSTNCLLNSFANVVHKRRFNFNPYSFELAGLVRQGVMDRELALERLRREEDSGVVEAVRKRLAAGGEGNDR